MELQLQSRALKASMGIDPAALAGVVVPNGLAKITLRVGIGGRRVTADVSAKALRRAVTMIVETGADGVALILTGKLEPGDVLAEAGIAAMPRAPKVAAA